VDGRCQADLPGVSAASDALTVGLRYHRAELQHVRQVGGVGLVELALDLRGAGGDGLLDAREWSVAPIGIRQGCRSTASTGDRVVELAFVGAPPQWLDYGDKFASIVGGVAGVVGLVMAARDRGGRSAPVDQGMAPRPRRGWLRLAAGLFSVALAVAVLRSAGVLPSAFLFAWSLVALFPSVLGCVAVVLHILVLRRQRMPLPGAVWDMLRVQREVARRHQYEYLLGSPPPLPEIYVEQNAEPWLALTAGGVSSAPSSLSLSQMLAISRNALVVADPGGGKSTSVARVLRDQCAWWLEATRSSDPRQAPYGPVVPMVLPADLCGLGTLPRAMAHECERLTGFALDPKVFERPPLRGTAWLIVIDGIDQMLRTSERSAVVNRLGDWIGAYGSGHRFMITTRPLLPGEINLFSPDHISRFSLKKFDRNELRDFAERWALHRERTDTSGMSAMPFSAERFLASVASASLSAIVQVPLIATITAQIFEVDQDKALPTSRSGLYERYVQHLLKSRQDDWGGEQGAHDFGSYGDAGTRAWEWLRGNLLALLEGIADLLLAGASDEIPQCAKTWIKQYAPDGMFDAIPGWDAPLNQMLISTGLIVSTSRGLRFGHPSFAEYLAAGPRGRALQLDDPEQLETWLADVRGPDSRNVALFTLARVPSSTGPFVTDRLVELLLARGGAETCVAGFIIADGIAVSEQLWQRTIDALVGHLVENDQTAPEALRVLQDLAVNPVVAGRLTRITEDSDCSMWVRAFAADALCTIGSEGDRLLRHLLDADDGEREVHAWILGRLVVHGSATEQERARAARSESAQFLASGALATEWCRQAADDPERPAGQRLRAVLTLAEHGDPQWPARLETVLTLPTLNVAARLDAARRVMQLGRDEGTAVLRRLGETEGDLDVRVPLLAAMAETQDVQARQTLNRLAAAGGPGLRQRYPDLASWTAEVGDRSAERGERQLSEREPAIWGEVPQQNKNFTGREDFLTHLHASITTVAALVPHALHGLGGIGKTAIAAEYAYRYRSEYDVVWWIPADQPTLVRISLASLAPQLGLPPATETGIAETAAAVLDALRRGEPYERWLLIFDHADQPEDIDDLIPRGPGHVLITSRNHRWESVVDTVAVDVFTREESVHFLSKRVAKDINKAEADRLADALGDLPLALEQAGALQAETGMPVEEYLELLAERTSQILAVGRPSAYPESMTAAWSLSVERLGQRFPEAVELLRCCAFFGPEPIPFDVFRQESEPSDSVLGRGVLADPITRARAIRELGRFALIRIDASPDRTIQVHRLIQVLLRDELDPAEQARYRHEVHRLLAGFARESPETTTAWTRYSALVPHVTASDVADCADPAVRRFALNTVRYLYRSGDHRTALEHAEHFVSRWTERSGADHIDVLSAQRHLGIVLRELGDYSTADELNRETLERALRRLGPEHEETLLLIGSRGADLRARGDFAAAREHDENSLRQHRQIFGDTDERTLHAMDNLALDHGLTSDYQTARELHLETLRQQTASGKAQVDLLSAWTNLCRAVRLSGDYTEACDAGEDAFAYGTSDIGAEHPQTLQAAKDLSIARRRAGAIADALELAEDVHAKLRHQFGDDHPDTLGAAVNLSNALRAANRIHIAYELAEDALRRCLTIYGNDHPYRHGCAGNLAVLQRLRGHPRDARDLNQAALNGLDVRIGRNHHYSLTIATNLASDLTALGEITAARNLGEDTLQRLRTLLGEDHPTTLACASNLATDRKAQGAEEAAENLFQETINRYNNTLGPEHPDTNAALKKQRLNPDFDPLPTQ
jgi:hypothetical protein